MEIIASNPQEQLNEWLTKGDAAKMVNDYYNSLEILNNWDELELVAYAYKRGRMDERGNNGGN